MRVLSCSWVDLLRSGYPPTSQLARTVDLNLHPRSENVRLTEAEALLEGASIVACMGDRLTLASFGMAMPIWPRLLAAVTTADEALERVARLRPDLLFVTEELEQGYGISLVSEVERLYPSTRTMIFCVERTRWW